jgi:hypothetical protein
MAANTHLLLAAMHTKIERMQGYELRMVWNALGQKSWNAQDMFDAKEGITMDQWAESIKSRLDFVNRTKVTAYQVVGWWKGKRHRTSSNMSDGALFISKETAELFASRYFEKSKIVKLDDVSLSSVRDPFEYNP